MAAKKEAAPVEVPKAPQKPAIDTHNPATDPTKTAQERLDALTKQQNEMHATK